MRGQQAKQRCPDLPLHSNLFCFLGSSQDRRQIRHVHLSWTQFRYIGRPVCLVICWCFAAHFTMNCLFVVHCSWHDLEWVDLIDLVSQTETKSLSRRIAVFCQASKPCCAHENEGLHMWRVACIYVSPWGEWIVNV